MGTFKLKIGSDRVLFGRCDKGEKKRKLKMMLKVSLSLLLVLVASTFASEQLSCVQTFCGKGMECVEGFREPVCECIERCPKFESKVCGSDGVTYSNECELYKNACVTKKEIELVSHKTCEEESEIIAKNLNKFNEEHKNPSPVVCLEKDRDFIRNELIAFLSKEVDGHDAVQRSYKSLLADYFKILDVNKDGSLDSMEFMALLDKNATISEALSTDKEASNPLLKGLCTDAIISITDKNSDYKLALEEFRMCLDPSSKPPKSQCEVENVKFTDGQVINRECNTCTCACGNWVCTAIDCGGQNFDTKQDE